MSRVRFGNMVCYMCTYRGAFPHRCERIEMMKVTLTLRKALVDIARMKATPPKWRQAYEECRRIAREALK